jgi:hypothetical protein
MEHQAIKAPQSAPESGPLQPGKHEALAGNIILQQSTLLDNVQVGRVDYFELPEMFDSRM